jgi:DNA-binding transcriptional LysR family regulator
MFVELPMIALRTFESAARQLSFKNAAEELGVTPPAVSHRVRTLERWMGIALFERVNRGVTLTSAGRQLFECLHDALLDVARRIDMLRPARPRILMNQVVKCQMQIRP